MSTEIDARCKPETTFEYHHSSATTVIDLLQKTATASKVTQEWFSKVCLNSLMSEPEFWKMSTRSEPMPIRRERIKQLLPGRRSLKLKGAIGCLSTCCIRVTNQYQSDPTTHSNDLWSDTWLFHDGFDRRRHCCAWSRIALAPEKVPPNHSALCLSRRRRSSSSFGKDSIEAMADREWVIHEQSIVFRPTNAAIPHCSNPGTSPERSKAE